MFLKSVQSSITASAAPAHGSGSWSRAWARPAFRWQLLIGLSLGLVLALTLPHYFTLVQARPGHLLADPILSRLVAYDVSGPTFVVIYLSIAAALAHAVPRPMTLLRMLWAYLLLHAFRILTLWLVPLAPPTGLVLLHDPIVDSLFYASAVPITKDLFFSGHTATLMLLALAVRAKWLQRTLFLMTVVVAALVLIQHAHYTYDVLAAPVFAGLSYWLAGNITRWAGASRRVLTARRSG